MSRRIETAATDTKSLTTNTDRKRLGRSAVRRKRKNIQIRKLNRKSNKFKKSAKSLVKVDPDNDWIHEKNEEDEENDENYAAPFNNDLKELEIKSHTEPEKVQNLYEVMSIRNSSVINNSSTYGNNLIGNPFGSKKESRKTTSMKKPVSELIVLQKSPFEGRPMTVFFQYPGYCGCIRKDENTVSYTQEDFKKKGYNLSFKITGSTHVYNSVVNSMKNAGFNMITR